MADKIVLYVLQFRKHANTSGFVMDRGARNICDAIGVVGHSGGLVQEVRKECFDPEDQPRSGRPVAVDEKRLLELFQEDPLRFFYPW